MIRHEHSDQNGFDIDEAVDDIIEWAAEYATSHGICGSVTSELLAMAAAKSRILTHYQLEHDEGEEDAEDDNGR